MFKKLVEFLKKLFGKKTVENASAENTEEVKEETPVVELVKEESTVASEEKIEDPVSKEEEIEDVVEAVKEVVDEHTGFLSMSDEDKDAICDILRPVIKKFNSDSAYIKLCEDLLESKVLKNFAKLSDDKTTLTIKLTQNEDFNKLIKKFIKKNVKNAFTYAIVNASLLGQYKVSATDEGEILIQKIG